VITAADASLTIQRIEYAERMQNSRIQEVYRKRAYLVQEENQIKEAMTRLQAERLDVLSAIR
jgi:hypothetical protein